MQDDFTVGDWRVSRQLRTIERDGESVQVRPKAMAVLVCLATAGGRPVSRDELFEQVWAGVIVSDDTLTQNIVELRKAFGDSAREAKVIETIPKLGFRLVPEVSELSQELSQEPAIEKVIGKQPQTQTVLQPELQPDSGSRNWPVLALVAVLIMLVVFFLLQPSSRPILRVEQSSSLAVLPFLDMSAQQNQRFIAQGLAEELQVNLAQLRGLQVTGRTSAAYFRDHNAELSEIGERLQVDHVLEGSVQESGERLRVLAKLVNVENGYQVWSGSYELEGEDLFEVQDRIAESVATALSITLSVGELGAINGGTRNIKAYRTYLEAWSIYEEGSAEAHFRALDEFKRAAELDPNYGLAWERIAHLYLRLPLLGDPQLSENWQENSALALERALVVAPESPSILATAAVWHSMAGEWREAEQRYQQVENLSQQGLAPPLFNFANYLYTVGKFAEAIELYKQAQRIEPLSSIIALVLGNAYSSTRQFDLAEQQYEKSYRLSPGRTITISMALGAAQAAGHAERLDKWERRAKQNDMPGWFAQVAELEEMVGLDPEAISRREQWFNGRYVSLEGSDAALELDAIFAALAAGNGHHDMALKFYARNPLISLLWLPEFTAMRQLPGFNEVVRKLGLVDYWQEFGWADLCDPLDGEDFECR
jgi:TolB-like protein/DNA-binding winged helix-turn-helix (wHTH) protein/Tfp pilus assembly protein PilF